MHTLHDRALPARLDLNLLALFEALWQERHVGRAAARIALSQPAASHALARLRRLVGDPLFERAGGAMRPTPRAEAMWPDVAAAMAAARAAIGGRGAAPWALGRPLRLALSGNTALTLLPGLAAHLRAAAPELDLEAVPADAARAAGLLRQGAVDAALAGAGAIPGAGLARRAIYAEPVVLAARIGAPALEGEMTPARFAALPQVAVSPSGRAGPAAADRALAALGLSRRVALRVPDWRIALEAIAASDLAGLLAEGPVARLGPLLGVGARPSPIPLDPLRIELVAPASAAALADWLAEALRAARPS